VLRRDCATCQDARRNSARMSLVGGAQRHMITGVEAGIAELHREVDAGLACFRDAVERSLDHLKSPTR
jgi:hypothetical protein